MGLDINGFEFMLFVLFCYKKWQFDRELRPPLTPPTHGSQPSEYHQLTIKQMSSQFEVSLILIYLYYQKHRYFLRLLKYLFLPLNLPSEMQETTQAILIFIIFCKGEFSSIKNYIPFVANIIFIAFTSLPFVPYYLLILLFISIIYNSMKRIGCYVFC